MSKPTITLENIAKSIGMSEGDLLQGLEKTYGLIIDNTKRLTDTEKNKIIQYVHSLRATDKPKSAVKRTLMSKRVGGKRGVNVEFKSSKPYVEKPKITATVKIQESPPPPPPPPLPPTKKPVPLTKPEVRVKKEVQDQQPPHEQSEEKKATTVKPSSPVEKNSLLADTKESRGKKEISTKVKAKKKSYISPEGNINPNKYSKSLYKLAQIDEDSVVETTIAPENKGSATEDPKAKIQAKHQFIAPSSKQILSVEVGESISVFKLASKLQVKGRILLKNLKKIGITVDNVEDTIDYDTAFLLAEEMGHKIIPLGDDLPDLESSIQRSGKTEKRPPIVTIMGHVDHGKTSLLDYIRKSKVADKEIGGITQHLSAYHVETNHTQVTFIDTPGHAAFTAMRARGTKFTDIVVLIIAADDGVMPQTIEIIQHVKAANVTILVAINKIDKPDINADKVLQGLSQHGVVAEAWGGDVPVVELSAKTGQGVDELLEMLVLQAEIMELEAYHQGAAEGIILECRIDKGRGVVVSALVQHGELKQGDVLLCGEEFGRVRGMIDSHAKSLKKVGPSIPVELFGFNGLPQVGDKFIAVKNEKQAREMSESRKAKKREEIMGKKQVSLDDLFSMQSDEEIKQINLVIRADTNGSMEAIVDSLKKLSQDKMKISIVAQGIGGIKESDVTLAMAHQAIIIGFNVRADKIAREIIEKEGIDLHYYSIIYEMVDQVKQAILGRLDPEYKEKIIGVAEVRDVFHAPKIGAIAGCVVIEGEIKRNNPIRILRGDIVIYEGVLESLRRFKEDVNTVKNNTECGIGVKNYNDIKINDKIEVYERVEVKPNL